jgi:ubiquinol-cytochrome c reductase cytochrome c subunit
MRATRRLRELGAPRVRRGRCAFRVLRAAVPLLIVGACSTLFVVGRARAATSSTVPVDTSLIAEGHRLYLTGCTSCHGLDGSGVRGRGPSLVGVGAASADFFLSTGRMPAAAGTGRQAKRKQPAYDRRQIDALVAYVASLGPGPAIPLVSAAADEVVGGELYRANCASCHQSAGGGGALSYGQQAPALDRSTRRQVVEAMRIGPGQMPVFGPSTISDEQAASIASYVAYLRAPRDQGGIPLGRIGPVTEGFVALVFGLGGLLALGVWLVGSRGDAAAGAGKAAATDAVKEDPYAP